MDHSKKSKRCEISERVRSAGVPSTRIDASEERPVLTVTPFHSIIRYSRRLPGNLWLPKKKCRERQTKRDIKKVPFVTTRPSIVLLCASQQAAYRFSLLVACSFPYSTSWHGATVVMKGVWPHCAASDPRAQDKVWAAILSKL